MIRKSIVAFWVAFFATVPPFGAAHAAERWVACGDDQLRFYEAQGDTLRETDRLRWSDLNIPQRFANAEGLDGLVECKPVNNGRELLVTSWKGGVARIDIAAKAVTFAAYVPHAHSAELLPHGRIAVVGNLLRIFDEGDGHKPLIEMPLHDGHGIVWDAGRKLLYVLSEDHLESFALAHWDSNKPKLVSQDRTRLPGQGDGHDLSQDTDGRFLVSTRDGVWHFEPRVGSFTPCEGLNPLYRPQSIVRKGDRMAWVLAEESWWGRGFFTKRDGGEVHRIETRDLRLYSVRDLSQ